MCGLLTYFISDFTVNQRQTIRAEYRIAESQQVIQNVFNGFEQFDLHDIFFLMRQAYLLLREFKKDYLKGLRRNRTVIALAAIPPKDMVLTVCDYIYMTTRTT